MTFVLCSVILLWDKRGDKSYKPGPLKSTGRHTHLNVVSDLTVTDTTMLPAREITILSSQRWLLCHVGSK